MNWKQQLYESVNRIATQYVDHPGILGVAIGGSVARGMAWKYSDLELCVVVEDYLQDLDYFNYLNNIGVEIIQIKKQNIQEFLADGDSLMNNVLQFPIQIYKCRIVHDPSGILMRFKDVYDATLFHPEVTQSKRDNSLTAADQRYKQAMELLDSENDITALAHLRLGMNDLLLAYYWHYNILPRSQNRTIYLLKQNAKKFGFESFYKAFIQLFCLKNPLPEMKKRLFQAQPAIYHLAQSGWGSNSVPFLQNAVDQNLEWGYETSILYVYKWCVHLLQSSDNENQEIMNREFFCLSNPELYRFLDYDKVTKDNIRDMAALYREQYNALINDKV
ncbi:nucleotidyltransferase domain-containing protein [Paenibacillus glycanilyticus]|uniref:Polymerase nucleotidyl transferase domain-containing protein n=1 Tax=Paenibacillus glycanilyticus TaxID=126569 RepID=A0ABQ6GFM5_9BACL|nr:nucleotidyltransferase domain-containing protein [Paenibacillus glycanilyticus]GLX68462.1 hypothetical protein MU1_28070 [Paenibacillus glycanilyticus]